MQKLLCIFNHHLSINVLLKAIRRLVSILNISPATLKNWFFYKVILKLKKIIFQKFFS